MNTSKTYVEAPSPAVSKPITSKKFGTLSGVLLPAIINLFGVIFFLRMGWIIGNSGLFCTLLIISLSCLVTLITAFSISATVTNMKMGAGGVYFMLSRTFGIEAGSAICLPLYLAQTIGISFSISGFTESIHPFISFIPAPVISILILGVITGVAFFSTSLALRSQTVIFFILILSFASIFLGKKTFIPEEVATLQTLPFWMLFPLFFPAVTGIESSIGLAGDLKNPRFSLPIGIIGAVLTGFIIYVSISVYLAHYISKSVLLSHPHILQEIAWIKQLVLVGIWGGTLSVSLSSIVSTPRTLHALAEDGVIFRFFGKNLGNSQNPRVAILCTTLIALIGILFGNINSIAPILTMFFLLSYCMLNLAAGLEGFFQNPSWRPTFRTHPLISLSGATLCFFCMLMMSVFATFLSAIFALSIYVALKKRSFKSNWDDIRQSILLFLSRSAIYRLSTTPKGPKTWRPNLLAFVGDPILRAHLIQFTENLTHGKGFLSIASIYPKKELEEDMDFTSYKEKMHSFFSNLKLPALVEIKYAPTVIEGMKTFINNYGIGGLIPNTIVLGATTKKDQFYIYAEVVMLAHQLKRNIILIRESNQSVMKKNKRSKQIDLWWGGQCRRNSDFMLVLAYMLQTSKEWKGSKLNLKTVISQEKYKEVMLKNFQEFTELGRLHVHPEVVTIKENEK